MNRPRCDVLIVTALKEELDALLALELDGQGRSGWQDAHDQSGFPFHFREVTSAHRGRFRVAAAWTGGMGETAAATRAQALVRELDPTCLAMCGICAGRREEVFLGDVIVAERVYSYGQGKVIAARNDHPEESLQDFASYNLDATWKVEATYFAEEFQRRALAVQRPPSRSAQRRWLLRAIHACEQQAGPAPQKHAERDSWCPDWARSIQELRKEGLIEDIPGELKLTGKGRALVEEELLLDPDGKGQSDPPFRVHVGPLVTGHAVREDPELFQRLRRDVRKVLGMEMEAAAIGFVAQQSHRHLLIVKAVSDYADHDKDDAFRGFACHASAAFLLAFLSRNLRPERNSRAPRPGEEPSPMFEPGQESEEERRREFLAQVEQACRLHHAAGTRIERRPGPLPFGEYLEVSAQDGRFIRLFPVAALDQPVTEEILQSFVDHIHADYKRRNPAVISTLVHTGSAAPVELAGRAHEQQVRLQSFAEYQGLFDFTPYLQRQTARLGSDPVYPPLLYVEQRARVSVGGQELDPTEDVLNLLQELLDSPQPRFALVLGDFGTGKTFVLHELARRMAAERTSLVPVLIEMRSLQKHQSLKALIAQHFAAADIGRLETDQFLYMLREGRIALLFDGFDELALRVTYERVMEHFGTLVEAAQGRAKVIITSRTQHFLTDNDVKRELAQRAEALPGYRLIKLEPFNEEQIRHFLVKRLGSETAAAERLALLHDVKDLRGLSANPRLLSFIAELEPTELQEAREGSGSITSARLYELLIRRWLKGEHERVNPPGAPKGLSLRQLWNAATDLALRLWERTERTVEMRELPEGLLQAVNAGGEHVLDAEVIRHQLGSGTLLVRDEEGRFSFVHQSVLEWLVARKAAQEIQASQSAASLEQRAMSDLMADFFIDLAGPERACNWAMAEAASPRNDAAKKNAIRVLRRLRETRKSLGASTDLGARKDFQGSDLRGQNMSRVDLRGARLEGANLSGSTLVEANLSEAHLNEAQLGRANLERAALVGADLSKADLSGARLLGADLSGAKLAGAKLRGAMLVGARVDAQLASCDVFGAAMPHPQELIPTIMSSSVAYAVAFSPTDPILATGHSDGTVRLWDTHTGAALRVLPAHEGAVLGLAFSPDGLLLASASGDTDVFLWEVRSARLLRVLVGHVDYIRSVAFSPDGTLVASGSDDRTVLVWSVATGQLHYTLTGHSADVMSIAFSPDGAVLASGSVDASIILYDLPSERVLNTLLAHSLGVLSIAFSPDGSLLASGSADETVALWDVREGRTLNMLPGHVEGAVSLAFSPNGATLAVGCGDGSIILWQVGQRQILRVLKGSGRGEVAVAVSPDSTLLASAFSNGVIRLQDFIQGQSTRFLVSPVLHIRRAAMSPDGAMLAAGCGDGTLCLWNVTQGRLERVLSRQSDSIVSLAFDPRGRMLASAGPEGQVVIRSLEPERIVGRYRNPSRGSVCLAFSPDGLLLAVGSAEGNITLWRVEDAERVNVLKGHSGNILSVAFNPDGTRLVSGSVDRTLIVWSLPEGKALQTLRHHQNDVLSVAFSPDGARLASGSADKSVAIWKLGEETPERVFEDASKGVLDVAFSPDGRHIAYAGRSVILRRVDGEEPVLSLGDRTERVLSLGFSPDGTMLFSTSTDNALNLFDAETGGRIATFLKRPEGWAVFRPDGRFKMVGNLNGTFWHAVGLCRFEPGELDAYLSEPLRLPDDAPLVLPRARGT
ncbi:WD40 domain-containing protein [Hyalangium gracile]|uniref:WD40 domain-containing protein n=1 Tax=Hyalangium gracile TaxID=394092 RepID=UPI001CC9FD65|nr:pentapeptide repeat-containing protein [Hyalangium gracile]